MFHVIIVEDDPMVASINRKYAEASEGFRVDAVFDVDPAKIGQEMNGVTIRDLSGLEEYMAERPADIAVLAVPVQVAQEIFDRLRACGVQAVWNFTPTDLRHNEREVIVVNVHLSDSLQVLSYKIKHRGE